MAARDDYLVTTIDNKNEGHFFHVSKEVESILKKARTEPKGVIRITIEPEQVCITRLKYDFAGTPYTEDGEKVATYDTIYPTVAGVGYEDMCNE